MKTDRPVVAQYNSEFFDKAETFIYNYVSNLKNFHPIFFARRFSNPDLFPLRAEDKYVSPAAFPDPAAWARPFSGILRKFQRTSTGEEYILRRRKARLIHAHFGPQGFTALALRGKYAIPVVTNFYGYDVSQLARDAQWRERYLTLFKEGALFLAEGEFMKSKLIGLGCPERKVRIQRIAIPVDKIPFRPRQPKREGEKPVLIFSGRFVEKKGLLYALQAASRLFSRGKQFEFRIIGDGPLKPAVEAFIQEPGMAEYVKLLGFLNYRDYLNRMGEADIFIHPSVTAADGDSEGGAPTVILEAQASGLPVISTTHADIPNIVVPGKSALLSPERDVEGLAENIARLLDDQGEWAAMGRAGREFVEQYHDIGKEVDSLEEKYRSVIK